MAYNRDEFAEIYGNRLHDIYGGAKTKKRSGSKKSQVKRSGSKKSQVKRAPTEWNLHVQAVREANPGLSFKDALSHASKSYSSGMHYAHTLANNGNYFAAGYDDDSMDEEYGMGGGELYELDELSMLEGGKGTKIGGLRAAKTRSMKKRKELKALPASERSKYTKEINRLSKLTIKLRGEIRKLMKTGSKTGSKNSKSKKKAGSKTSKSKKKAGSKNSKSKKKAGSKKSKSKKTKTDAEIKKTAHFKKFKASHKIHHPRQKIKSVLKEYKKRNPSKI